MFEQTPILTDGKKLVLDGTAFTEVAFKKEIHNILYEIDQTPEIKEALSLYRNNKSLYTLNMGKVF